MIGSQIKSLLDPLCNQRVFLSIAPANTVEPYICYQRVSVNRDDVMSGQSGYQSQVFQIDIYAKKYTECDSLADLVIGALQSLTISQTDQQSSYESETGLYRETIEVLI